MVPLALGSWLVPKFVTKHVLAYTLLNFSVPRSSWGLIFLLGVGTLNMYNILKGHQSFWSNYWEIKEIKFKPICAGTASKQKIAKILSKMYNFQANQAPQPEVISSANLHMKIKQEGYVSHGQYGELANIWIFWPLYLSTLIRYQAKGGGIL